MIKGKKRENVKNLLQLNFIKNHKSSIQILLTIIQLINAILIRKLVNYTQNYGNPSFLSVY